MFWRWPEQNERRLRPARRIENRDPLGSVKGKRRKGSIWSDHAFTLADTVEGKDRQEFEFLCPAYLTDNTANSASFLFFTHPISGSGKPCTHQTDPKGDESATLRSGPNPDKITYLLPRNRIPTASSCIFLSSLLKDCPLVYSRLFWYWKLGSQVLVLWMIWFPPSDPQQQPTWSTISPLFLASVASFLIMTSVVIAFLFIFSLQPRKISAPGVLNNPLAGPLFGGESVTIILFQVRPRDEGNFLPAEGRQSQWVVQGLPLRQSLNEYVWNI